jgi:hypothetical protein
LGDITDFLLSAAAGTPNHNAYLPTIAPAGSRTGTIRVIASAVGLLKVCAHVVGEEEKR